MAGRRLVVPRSARSEVWNYFGFEADELGRICKTDKRYVFCRMCDTKLLFSGNTTNLSSHIGRCPKRMFMGNYYQGTSQASTATPTNDISTDFFEELTSMTNQNASEQEVFVPAARDENITILDIPEGKQEYCLKWKHHQANQQSMFFQLLETERFCDVSIVCEEKFLKAHKLVLSACSSYFENVLSQFEDRSPVVILRGVKHSDMAALIQFMYKGEINIEQDQLSSLLEAADFLKVKGLSDICTEGQKLFSTEAAAKCETSMQQDSKPSPSREQNKRTMPNMEVHKPVKMQRSDSEPGVKSECTTVFTPGFLHAKPRTSAQSICEEEGQTMREGNRQAYCKRERHYIEGIVQMNKYLKEKGKFEQFWKEPWVIQAMKDVSRRLMTIKDCSDLLGVPYRIMYTHYRQVRDNEYQVYREQPTTVSQEGGRITLKCNEIAPVPADKKNRTDVEMDPSIDKKDQETDPSKDKKDQETDPSKDKKDQEIDPSFYIKVESMDSCSQ